MTNLSNLLKSFFLLVNLISPAVFLVGSFSLPLSRDEDIVVGQNSSRLTKRNDIPTITLVSGTIVTGVSIDGNGKEARRQCTLSFPVVSKFDGSKGFLTAWSCALDYVLYGVSDTKIGFTPSGSFSPTEGLDYTFVQVYPEFWDDEISRNMTYSQCDSTGEGDVLIPLIPTPNEPPYSNFTVCLYGGLSGFICGVIVDFNSTILTYRNPLHDQPETFYPVTKVKMESSYFRADLGAPVYIPLQVPNSTQFIASPVGQVVENVGENTEENIWYYTPLDKIIKDSNLEIAFGDLSHLLPPNPSAANTSQVNMMPRQPIGPQAVITYGGFDVWFSSDTTRFIESTAKKCTLGFPIRKNTGPPRSRFDHGFLTAGSCQIRQGSTNGVFRIQPSLENPNVNEIIRIGTSGSTIYSPNLGLSFNVIRLLPNSDQYTFWNDDTSASVKIPFGFADIIAEEYVPNAGTPICFWGSYSGHICGTVIQPRAQLTRLNPWRFQIYIQLILAGHVFDLYTPDDNFRDVIKVRLDTNPRAFDNNLRADRGAPVYFPNTDNHHNIISVRPLGILLDYDFEFVQQDNQCVIVPYMYCVSVQKFMINYRDDGYQLIGEPDR